MKRGRYKFVPSAAPGDTSPTENRGDPHGHPRRRARARDRVDGVFLLFVGVHVAPLNGAPFHAKDTLGVFAVLRREEQSPLH